jgi:hypothetical protein
MRRFVWFRTLMNEEALAHLGLPRQKKGQTMRSDSIDVILLHSVRQHVSAAKSCHSLKVT